MNAVIVGEKRVSVDVWFLQRLAAHVMLMHVGPDN
jgi:hypothetical protein